MYVDFRILDTLACTVCKTLAGFDNDHEFAQKQLLITCKTSIPILPNTNDTDLIIVRALSEKETILRLKQTISTFVQLYFHFGHQNSTRNRRRLNPAIPNAQ